MRDATTFTDVPTFVCLEEILITNLFIADFADHAIGHLGAEVRIVKNAVGGLLRLARDEFVRQRTGRVDVGLKKAEIVRGRYGEGRRERWFGRRQFLVRVIRMKCIDVHAEKGFVTELLLANVATANRSWWRRFAGWLEFREEARFRRERRRLW